MRTTIDLPDETFRRLKVLAAERGVTLKQIFRDALDHELSRSRLESWSDIVSRVAGAFPDFPDLSEIRATEGKDAPRESF